MVVTNIFFFCLPQYYVDLPFSRKISAYKSTFPSKVDFVPEVC